MPAQSSKKRQNPALTDSTKNKSQQHAGLPKKAVVEPVKKKVRLDEGVNKGGNAKKARFEQPKVAEEKRKDVKGKAKEVVRDADVDKRKSSKGDTAKVDAKAKTNEQAINRTAFSQQPFRSFKVMAGSYERLLYGIECSFFPPANSRITASSEKLHIQPIFQFPAHISCVKSLAGSPPAAKNPSKSGGKWLATGSTDEVVKVWDLRKRKEVGGLMGNEGSITALEFASSRILLSGSADGKIAMFRTRDWALLKVFKGHTGRINSLAPHPSLRLLLSVGQDRHLRLWDLLGGSVRPVSSTKLSLTSSMGAKGGGGKLDGEAEVVRWSPSGERFVVVLGGGKECELIIYGKDLSIERTLVSKSRFHDVRFHPLSSSSSELMFVACEDGKVRAYRIDNRVNVEQAASETVEGDKVGLECIAELTGHKNRVKQIDIIEVAVPCSGPKAALSSSSEDKAPSTALLSTASSDGFINIYSISDLVSSPSPASESKAKEIKPIASYDTKGSRLTCVSVSGSWEEMGSEDEVGVRVAVQAGDEDVYESLDEEDEDDEDEDEDEEDEEVGEDDDDEALDEGEMESEGDGEEEEEDAWGGLEEEEED